MKVILASNNKNKLDEIKKVFNFDGWDFFTLSDLNINSDPEENAPDFIGNAKIKAKAAFEIVKKSGLNDYAIVADDSGLCVDVLDGKPGVYSARFASENGEHCTYADNNKKLIKVMKDVPDDKRGACFKTAAYFIFPDGKEVFEEGCCFGKIGYEEIGDNGFGFDPLFFPDYYNHKLTMAQVSPEEKDAISHRGQAFRNLKESIKKELQL